MMELLVRCFHIGRRNNNTSLFIIISHCFTVRVSNQLTFRPKKWSQIWTITIVALIRWYKLAAWLRISSICLLHTVNSKLFKFLPNQNFNCKRWKEHKRLFLTSAGVSIACVSCFTWACVRSHIIATHRINVTAVRVGRTLVDIWRKKWGSFQV